MTLSFPQADTIIDQLTTRIHELIGTDYRDAAIAAADRAEAEADRAQAAADTVVTGVPDGSVTRPKLGPDVVAELEGKADQEYVDGHLASSTRSGISLLPMVPGTNTPMWAASFREVTDDVPPGEKVAYANNEDGSKIEWEWKDGWVKVAPQQQYRVRVWMKADTPGSNLVLWGYGDDGSRGIEGNTLGTSSTYPAWVRNIPTEWTLYEGTFRIRDGVNAFRVGGITWNHSGDDPGAVQYISGFEIWPDYAPGEHTHTSADITDTTSTVSGVSNGGKILRLGNQGTLFWNRKPVSTNDLTNKSYVDGEVETRTTPDTVATMISQAVAGLVGSAPDALDTVYEIAAYLTDDGVVGGLIEQLSRKAEAGHKHTSADITDAYHYVGDAASAGRVVKTHSNGHIYLREDPPAPDTVPRRKYVDDQVAKKADTKHTHTTADLPTSYYADADAETMKLLLTGSDGFLHSRTDPDKPSHLVRKAYVDQEVAKKADASHTHTSANITDTVYRAGTTAAARKVISASGTGRLYYDRTPAATDELTNKEYVDQEVGKKADTGHKHSVSDISGLPAIEAGSSTADSLVQRDANGRITIRGGTSSNHAVTRAQLNGKADKSYVDERIQLVAAWPTSPEAGVLYLMEEE